MSWSPIVRNLGNIVQQVFIVQLPLAPWHLHAVASLSLRFWNQKSHSIFRYYLTQWNKTKQCTWCKMRWNEMGWGEMRLDEMRWDEIGWDEMRWDGMGWDGMGCDGMGWDGMGWDEMRWDRIRSDQIRWTVDRKCLDKYINNVFRQSQYIFWYFLHTSANNLVYLAWDRYRCVCKPLHYKDFSKYVSLSMCL